MHGWTEVDTARCERCRVYTPTTDLVFSKDGRSFCTTCGVPAARSYAPPPRVATDVGALEWELGVLAGSPTRLEHHARVAALVMLAVTLCFPLAACVSQL